MKNLISIILTSSVLVILTFTVIACSDDSGSSQNNQISSLYVPTSIDVVPSNGNLTINSNAAKLISGLITTSAVTDSDTDYSTDTATVFNEDAAANEMKSINYLLCLIDKFKYDEKLNEGPYNIVIDFESCYQKIYPEFVHLIEDSAFIIEGTVNSTRENNSSPHVISAWLTSDSDKKQTNNPAEIQPQFLLELFVFNSVSAEYPYGNFEMNIATVGDAGNYGGAVGVEYRTSKDTYRSYLDKNNMPAYKTARYSERDAGENIELVASTVLLTSENSSSGALHNLWSFTYPSNPESNYNRSTLLDFNESHVLSSDFMDTAEIITNQRCLSRNETFDEYWRYNLYHNSVGQFRDNIVTAGERVKLTSRINFYYLGQYGSISNDYHWLENDTALPDGAQITSTANNNQYTAHVANGTIKQRQLHPVSLTDLQSQQLEHFGPHPISGVYGSWILNVDSNNNFVFAKKVLQGESGRILLDTYDDDYNSTTPEVPVAANLTLADGGSIRFSDESYHYYQYFHDTQIAPVDRIAKYSSTRSRNIANIDLFTGSITSVPLYCYDVCPKGGLTQNDVDTASSESELSRRYVSFDPTPLPYTLKIDGFKLQLIDNSNDLPVDASHLDLTKVSYYSGIRSGNMTTAPLPANATRATLEQQDVVYSWSSSPRFYDQMVTLSDSAGELVVLDEPINIEYTHDAAHDINNKDPDTNIHHGKTFNLTFNGDYLSGLPYNYDNGDFSYSMNLADGTVLSNTEGDYVTRANFIWQKLKVIPPSNCVGLDLQPLLANDALSLMTADEIVDVSFSAADKPNVNSPAIISQ